MRKKLICALALIFACTALGACSPQKNDSRLTRHGEMLNTVVTLTTYGTDDEAILDGAFELCAEYEAILSRTAEGSDIYRINHSGGEPVAISDATAELIGLALDYAELSGGAFDPSIEPIVSLWDITSESPRVPGDDEINQALSRVDWRGITLEGNTVTLRPGMSMDLGAIAKGYIADRLRDYFSDAGVTGALINLGGNVLTYGKKPDGSPFTVGVQKPFASNEVIGAYRISDMALTTSGIYERYFEQDGAIYHHIMDPKTGRPVQNDVYSVTILSPHSVDGDALSTICFVLGADDGLALINSMDGIYAVYCMADGSLIFSEGAEAEWIDKSRLQ